MGSLALLVSALACLVPTVIGIFLMVLAVRVQRRWASYDRTFGPFEGHREPPVADGSRDERLVTLYPRWAVILGWVVGVEFLIVGMAMGLRAVYATWILLVMAHGGST